MDLGLRGARALVTGASRGIGLAIADALAAEGADVALLARGAAGLEQAREQVGRHGGQVVTAAVDVTDAAALAAAVDDVAEQLGGLDKVVGNAGGTVGGNLLDSEAQDFLASFALNTGHGVTLVRAARPHFLDAGAGSVVLITSVNGSKVAPRTTYSVAKAGEIQLAKAMAQELAADNIRVNAVSPGSIFFPGGSWDRFQQDDPEAYERFEREEFPFGRLGRPEEVADVVAFVLSARGSLINGANVAVDGAQNAPSAGGY
jgi:3-oxoacyl-[acyl-carrier protein] reductase